MIWKRGKVHHLPRLDRNYWSMEVLTLVKVMRFYFFARASFAVDVQYISWPSEQVHFHVTALGLCFRLQEVVFRRRWPGPPAQNRRGCRSHHWTSRCRGASCRWQCFRFRGYVWWRSWARWSQMNHRLVAIVGVRLIYHFYFRSYEVIRLYFIIRDAFYFRTVHWALSFYWVSFLPLFCESSWVLNVDWKFERNLKPLHTQLFYLISYLFHKIHKPLSKTTIYSYLYDHSREILPKNVHGHRLTLVPSIRLQFFLPMSANSKLNFYRAHLIILN